MTQSTRILYVDHGNIADSLASLDWQETFESVRALTGVDAIKRLKREEFDLVLLPESLPDFTVAEFYNKANSLLVDGEIVVIGESIDLPADIRTIQYTGSDERLLQQLREIVANLRVNRAITHQDKLEAAVLDIAIFAVSGNDQIRIFQMCHNQIGRAHV